LCISGKRGRRAKKAAIVYLILSILSIAFDRLYALCGHGVRSASMSLMFLYPLLGGTLSFMLLWFFSPEAEDRNHSRLFFNLYNSGVAALTAGSLLQGVLDIAGTSSPYIVAYRLLGWLLVGITLTGWIGLAGRRGQRGRQGGETMGIP
jgi:hypothetical protein